LKSDRYIWNYGRELKIAMVVHEPDKADKFPQPVPSKDGRDLLGARQVFTD